MQRSHKITIIIFLAVATSLSSIAVYAFITGFHSEVSIPPYEEVPVQQLQDWVAAEGRTLSLPKWLPDGVVLTSANTLYIVTYSRWGDKNIRTSDVAIEFRVTNEQVNSASGADKVIYVGAKPIGIWEKTVYRPYYFTYFSHAGIYYMVSGRNLITEEDFVHIIESMIL
jgi:hypothetical protein